MAQPGSTDEIKDPKTDEELVERWMEKLRLGRMWRWNTSGDKDKKWKRYKEYYRGNWGWEDEVFDSGRSVIDEYLPTNRVFSYIRSTVPKVYFRNPGVYVSKGLVVNGIDDAPIIQDAATYLTRELDLKHIIKSTVLTTMLCGTGIVKKGYGSQYVAGIETVEEKTKRLEHATRIKPGLPWARTVAPENFIVPFGTKKFDDADWCAHEVYRPLEFAQRDKNYSHRKSFKGTKIANFNKQLVGSGDTSKDTDDLLWVKLLEIHDKTTNRLLILSDGGKLIHYKGTDVLQIEGLPFEVLIFDEDPDTMWGISTVKIMEPQQMEINDVRTMESQYRKREFVKILVDPAAGEGVLEAINDASTPMAAIKCQEPSKNVMVVSSSMPADLPRQAEEADNDMRLELGFSRNQAGEVSTGRRTAREIEVARQAAEIRNDERRDATSDFYANIVSGIMQISFLLMDEAMVKRITGGAVWHARDDAALPYDLGLEVNPEESQPMNNAVVKAEALELDERLANNPIVNPVARLAKLLQAYEEDLMEYLDPEISQAVFKILQKREEAAKEGGGEGA